MISVIIPVHNSENYLYNCLNSILMQSYQNFEVICINDNSNDSSKDILEYFALKDSRINIINNETKRGEVYCKNKGFEVAKGKYITFLQCSEWISSRTLDELFKHAENNSLDMIFYNNNDSDFEDFKIYNFADLDISQFENDGWSNFYLKSALINKDSIEKISFINKFFKSSQMLNNIDDSLGEIVAEENLKQLRDQINKLEILIQKQQNQIDDFIDSQKYVVNHIRNSADIFIIGYNESRRYFFNNQEDKLKKYFDTEELFKMCYYNNFKFLSYSPEENRILIKTEDGIILGSNNRFYTIKEVIGFNGYSIPQLYDFDEFIVFDIGMNRSYASLWFANFDNCKFVYGFEIDPETYNKALSNINLNPRLSNKIKTFNYGLSNETEDVDLYYVSGCDGVNTMFSDVANLQSELQDKNKVKTKKVHVKKASEILSKIIKCENITSNIVLKIDTEGAEYNIIEDLIKTNIISQIDVLLGEGHLLEREHYCDKLKELGFKQVELDVHQVTYNFAFVKDEHFNVWPLKE